MSRFVMINNDVVNTDQVVLARDESRGSTQRVIITLSGGQKKILLDVTVEEVLALLNGEEP